MSGTVAVDELIRWMFSHTWLHMFWSIAGILSRDAFATGRHHGELASERLGANLVDIVPGWMLRRCTLTRCKDTIHLRQVLGRQAKIVSWCGWEPAKLFCLPMLFQKPLLQDWLSCPWSAEFLSAHLWLSEVWFRVAATTMTAGALALPSHCPKFSCNGPATRPEKHVSDVAEVHQWCVPTEQLPCTRTFR